MTDSRHHDGEQPEPEATPVAPPPMDTAPSSTGVVAGDDSELREAPPSPDAGEGEGEQR